MDFGRKRKARKIREGTGKAYIDEETGELSRTPLHKGHQPSTHLMVDDIRGNESGTYNVWPDIAPTGDGGYRYQSGQEAWERGEMFSFKSKRHAERFAHGSWKKGKEKRDAMSRYRKGR